MSRDPRSLTFSSETTDEHVVNAFWRLWLPIGGALGVLVLHSIDRDLTWDLLFVEGTGLFEILHIILPLATTLVALRVVTLLPKGTDVLLKVWVWALAIGCFYIAGEEASWGQHIFGWETPEGWSELNRQQETNLHNTTSWLNHKPRVILNIGVLIGSVLVPIALTMGWWLQWIERFRFVLPGRSCHVTGWFVLFYMVWDDFAKSGDVPDITPRHSEMHENYLYGYLLIYAFVLKDRVLTWRERSAVRSAAGSDNPQAA